MIFISKRMEALVRGLQLVASGASFTMDVGTQHLTVGHPHSHFSWPSSLVFCFFVFVDSEAWYELVEAAGGVLAQAAKIAGREERDIEKPPFCLAGRSRGLRSALVV